jgi:hypothetical protein
MQALAAAITEECYAVDIPIKGQAIAL